MPQIVQLGCYAPTRHRQELLSLSIACGGDPNLQPDGSWPLGMAIVGIHLHREDPDKKDSIFPSWGTVATLIGAGADIHAIRSELGPSMPLGFYMHASWLASHFEVLEDWFAVLRMCGLCPIKVYHESERRLGNFFDFMVRLVLVSTRGMWYILLKI